MLRCRRLTSSRSAKRTEGKQFQILSSCLVLSLFSHLINPLPVAAMSLFHHHFLTSALRWISGYLAETKAELKLDRSSSARFCWVFKDKIKLNTKMFSFLSCLFPPSSAASVWRHQQSVLWQHQGKINHLERCSSLFFLSLPLSDAVLVAFYFRMVLNPQAWTSHCVIWAKLVIYQQTVFFFLWRRVHEVNSIFTSQ